MKKNIFIVVIFFFSQLIPLQSQNLKRSVDELPSFYQKWLKEEVVYIITEKERDIFLQLETDRERNLFIGAFWKIRDPIPGTPLNEFKEEHYQRISYANKFLGRETSRSGWQTDRGKIYIILGPPTSIDRFPDRLGLQPAEIWFYHGDTRYGFPSAFNLVFYKRDGIGEFRLYSPIQDGPIKLLRDSLVHYRDGRSAFLNPSDYQRIYEELFKLAPMLALNSISLIPGEQVVPGHLSMASDVLLSNVFTFPHKRVDDMYAEKLLEYKDIVEVEYTANYIYSDVIVKTYRDPSGVSFVHYAVEPSVLSIDEYEGQYISNFKIIGKVSDFEGKTIFQYEKNLALNFSEEQLQSIKNQSYSIQDMIPLIPGDYKFDVILKNTISKEFTSFEKDLFIPQNTSSLQMTPLLMGYKVEETETPLGVTKPFYFGRYQILSQANRTFLPTDQLFVFFQIYGLTPDLRETGTLRFLFYINDEMISEKKKQISEYHGQENFLEIFSLESFKPSSYEIQISLLDKNKEEILFERDFFEVTSLSGLARPWVFSKVMPTSEADEYNFILGNQLLNKGDLNAAKEYLENAYQKNAKNLKYAEAVSEVFFRLKNYRKVKDVLEPFVNEQTDNSNYLKLLGRASQALEEFHDAISYYKQYLSRMGTDLTVLNAIGTCYYKLGDSAQALTAWERSLDINPNQEEIKELVTSIKENRKI